MISAYEAKVLASKSKEIAAEAEAKKAEQEICDAAKDGKFCTFLSFVPGEMTIGILLRNGYNVTDFNTYVMVEWE